MCDVVAGVVGFPPERLTLDQFVLFMNPKRSPVE